MQRHTLSCVLQKYADNEFNDEHRNNYYADKQLQHTDRQLEHSAKQIEISKESQSDQKFYAQISTGIGAVQLIVGIVQVGLAIWHGQLPIPTTPTSPIV